MNPMRKTLTVLLTLGLFLFALVAPVIAQDDEKADAKREKVEKTGVLEVQPAAAGQKHATVLLKVGADTFKLLPTKKTKDLFPKLEALGGKEVTVKGKLLPADDKHPLAAIKVVEYTEGAAAAGSGAAPAAAGSAAAPAPEPTAAGSGSAAAPEPAAAGSGSAAEPAKDEHPHGH